MHSGSSAEMDSTDYSTLQNLLLPLLRFFIVQHCSCMQRQSNNVHSHFPPASCLLFGKMKNQSV